MFVAESVSVPAPDFTSASAADPVPVTWFKSRMSELMVSVPPAFATYATNSRVPLEAVPPTVSVPGRAVLPMFVTCESLERSNPPSSRLSTPLAVAKARSLWNAPPMRSIAVVVVPAASVLVPAAKA